MKILEKIQYYKKNKVIFLFFLCSLFFIIMSFIYLNLPFRIKINENIYKIFNFNFFLVKEISFFSYNIKIPNIIRFFSSISIIYTLSSIYFLIKKSNLFYFSIIPVFINLILNSSLKYFFKNLDLVIDLFGFNNFFISSIFLFFSVIFYTLIVFYNKIDKIIFNILAFFSVISVFSITIYIFVMGIPAILEIGILNFIFGKVWQPSENLFGILPFIISSAAAAGGAIIIGAPLGVLTAVFLTFFCPKWLAVILRMFTKILASVPSVVFGFFGITIIVPFIRKLFYGHTSGDSLLAAIIILSVMILPTIINVSEDSLKAVPKSFRKAALALGDTDVKIIFKVMIPSAFQGILSGVLLGISRAIGETMAVIMVAGNIVRFPELLKSTRFLTTGIALEMPYSSGLHRKALFAIGLILFIFIFIINLFFVYVSDKNTKKY